MKKLALFILVVSIVTACQMGGKEAATSVPTARVLWQTDTVLTTSESVIYDAANDVLYVSNIAGDPSGKDGNGSIGKVGLDGKVIDAQWIKGIDAPKGMGIWNGKLFVADIDRIHEIDIASSSITNSYKVDSALFLNDVTVDASGKVYVSDMSAGKIYLLENGSVSEWLGGVEAPNGLLSEGDNMMMALWNEKTLNIIGSDKKVTMKSDSLENPDGIEALGDGGYLVSSWNGMVHYVDQYGNTTMIVDTRADSISAADIEYIPEKRMLLVPTFFKNSVMAYEITK
jgi:sugar lactone lactonase YvrE